VEDALPYNVVYRGRPLASGERVYWKVQVFGQGAAGQWSKPAFFETGLLHPADWKGQWLNDGKLAPELDADFYREDPAPLFRREFSARHSLKRATLYIAGLGYYEAYLNGRKVGDRVLEPGWTKFGARVGYATYDVTQEIQPGKNCLGVMLGNGWYNPLPMRLFGSFNLREHLDIGRPRFIAQLEMEFADSSHHTEFSNLDWKVGEGAIRFDNIYLGEVVDARKDPVGWEKPGFNDSNWRSPSIARETVGQLQTSPEPPIRVTAHIKPVAITEPNPGVTIVDFGQEFAGWASLKLKAKAGAKIVLRYGELLNPDGSLNVMTSAAGQIKGTHKNKEGIEESTGGPGAPAIAWQSDTYIAKGGNEETYTPHFTFHGFRYMEITGLESRPDLHSITGLRLNADVQDAGSFECSNDRFNLIQAMVRRTFLSNLFSVQSDCPHRERLGYGGDMVGTSEAFILNFDMAGFYAKTVQDFADAARPDGMMTDTAPYIGIQYCGVGWAMAHPVISDQLDRYYGDRRTFADQYETAKRWLLLVEQQYPDGIVTDGLSDHESLEPTPAPIMVTPLFYESARLLSRMAADLNHAEDARHFRMLAEKIRAAYVAQFFDPATGKVGIGTQASQSFALYFDILPPENRQRAIDFLLGKIRQDDKGHLSTGLMGTKFMLDVLSRTGHSEDAYRIVNQPDFPGWGWMLANGATTLWEHWAKEEYTFSHCHPMFGSVSEWFINWLGGIQQAPGSTGFKEILIRPQFVKDLSWVRASHTCMFGKISTEWRRAGDRLILDVAIPVGATAEVYLPTSSMEQIREGGRSLSERPEIRVERNERESTVLRIGSGRYRFELPSH
jgi:alpha-L-rhamnosidase